MTKTQIKFVIFLGAIAVLIPAVIITITLLTQFVAYFQQGADPASIFRGHTLFVPDPLDMAWLPFKDEEPPKLSEQEEILAAYWMAWEALAHAHQNGNTADLATYWAGAAYDQAIAGVEADNPLFQLHSKHKLNLTFFSNDNSVAAFEDQNFVLVQVINGKSIPLRVSAKVVMTLDQGFWRVRSINLTFFP